MQSLRASWLGGKWDKKTCRYLICIGRPCQQLQFIDISLIILESSVSNHAGYQCPESGFPHFYWTKVSPSTIGKRCVNALSRAFLISTGWITQQATPFMRGVNALSRAFLISTPWRKEGKMGKYVTMCQCPISGFPHFY